jgi:hypothetical protein
MRPGPATRAALLSRIFCLPSFAMSESTSRPAPVRAHNPTMSARGSHLGFSGSALPSCLGRKDFFGGRNAWAPVHGKRTGFPPVIHPREPPATLNRDRQSFRMSALCLHSTLLHDASRRNSKAGSGCAETVEGGTFLWKLQEKRGVFRQQLARRGNRAWAVPRE